MSQGKPGRHSSESPSDVNDHFCIVGMGSSAGGLEAFEQFFRNVPTKMGLAFVLVSHLDPDYPSMLTEILQRTTSMPVIEAQDQMKVMADCVYTIPPNCEMTLYHGLLQLSVPELPRGHRMPIDAFLRSLAEDQGEKAIGIILSGTGTDGTLGLRAIQGAGGVTFVQDPATAKYDGMPVSAIQSGSATYVLPVESMPEQLLGIHRSQIAYRADPQSSGTTGSMNRILMLLRSATGHDFSLYKKRAIIRRIERRMLQHNIESLEVYTRYLKENPPEAQLLFKELLINVTSFFRDPEAFAALRKTILLQLLADKPPGSTIRIWVAGCATGEEAYSVAILLQEIMEEGHYGYTMQIYGTDIDDDAIAVARAGHYPANIVQDVSPERLNRFFIKENDGYRIKKSIREMVVFAIQNVIKDPPFTRIDLLCCRNLMIYLEPELQNRVIPTFHYALKPGGVLCLSPSESIFNHVDLFTPLDRKWKLYQATPSIASKRMILSRGLSGMNEVPMSESDDTVKKSEDLNFAELAKKMLLQSYTPAAVVTDLKGDILYIHGDTGHYLRPPPGQATLNIVEMAREELQLEMRNAIQNAVTHSVPTQSRELCIKGDYGRAVRIGVRPLPTVERADPGLLLVSFQDVACPEAERPGKGKRKARPAEQLRIEELERELAYTKENLQAIIEEQQASNEELKSTNEELEATNEELQSTNEELETSKEELQSVNEEMITVNAELQSNIEKLSGIQNDMKNLLDNINVGTIFLDEELKIKRFTREATKIYRLILTDVGRPLGDIKSSIDNDLLSEAQEVIDSLIPREREVRTADNSWYLVRIQPYRTLENSIEGVVLTFTDITRRILAETAVREAQELAESIVNTVPDPLVVLDGNMNIISASRAFYREFLSIPEETVGRSIYALGHHQWDIPKLRELLESILPNDRAFDDFEIEQDFPVIGKRKMLLSARQVSCKSIEKCYILLTIKNI
jgi:two-component system CheB/CheR fusion protein